MVLLRYLTIFFFLGGLWPLRHNMPSRELRKKLFYKIFMPRYVLAMNRNRVFIGIAPQKVPSLISRSMGAAYRMGRLRYIIHVSTMFNIEENETKLLQNGNKVGKRNREASA